jgi:hypothetical protein
MRGRFWILVIRFAVLAAFLWIFLYPRHNALMLWAQDPADRDASAWNARSLAILLLNSYPEALDDASRAVLRDAVATYDRGWAAIAQVYNQRSTLGPETIQEGLGKGDGLFRQSTGQVATVLARLPALSVGGTATVTRGNLSIPFGNATLLLKRLTGNKSPRFLQRRVDLSSRARAEIDVQTPADFYCLLEFINPPQGSSRTELAVMTGPELLGKVDLTVTVPPKYTLQVQVLDGDGHATEAAVGLYSSGKRFLVPATALDFSAGGYFYEPVRYRESAHTRYWPGGEDYSLRFFVSGGFTMEVPAGTYRLIAAKGPEFLPFDRPITLSTSAGTNPERIVLRRWINMAARGWYSGDTHLHYSRSSRDANEPLQLWTQAEDLRMGNILRMGDGKETYFEQYSFGADGRFVQPSFALVVGQEDPRTAVMGHIIGLNLEQPVRDLERGYYVYGDVFDDIHRQGGLAGYAHVTTYLKSSGAYRDMTINVARGKPDFEEICENGIVETEIYYDFLNLGFRLTAMGGSDVPWGGTAGESRVYVRGGSTFDPDRWFVEVKKGHTFVTAGPMLEFTVSGRVPGDGINARRGERLRVHAMAMVGSDVVRLERLEIVANGEVVRSAEPLGHSAVLDFELPAEHSMWIAARTAGAHTTPVYVTVDGKRHWKEDAVPALLDKCFRTLDEVDALINQKGANIEPNRESVWENAESFRAGAEELRKEVQEAREVYQRLRSEWQAGSSR